MYRSGTFYLIKECMYYINAVYRTLYLYTVYNNVYKCIDYAIHLNGYKSDKSSIIIIIHLNGYSVAVRCCIIIILFKTVGTILAHPTRALLTSILRYSLQCRAVSGVFVNVDRFSSQLLLYTFIPFLSLIFGQSPPPPGAKLLATSTKSCLPARCPCISLSHACLPAVRVFT